MQLAKSRHCLQTRLRPEETALCIQYVEALDPCDATAVQVLMRVLGT
jgi:hypothetical protein